MFLTSFSLNYDLKQCGVYKFNIESWRCFINLIICADAIHVLPPIIFCKRNKIRYSDWKLLSVFFRGRTHRRVSEFNYLLGNAKRLTLLIAKLLQVNPAWKPKTIGIKGFCVCNCISLVNGKYKLEFPGYKS